MDRFEYRKPRPDIPILPQSAIYRTQAVKPFIVPKGRKGRKPRGQKLKPRVSQLPQQFNKIHEEAARNKERDRAERERIDAIRERDEARRERSERLQIEDRRYAARVIIDARERAAERDFRNQQLRLLRQQVGGRPPNIEVRPVINLPQGQGAAVVGDYRQGREEARRFAAFREQVQADIRRGLGGLQEEIVRIGQGARGELTAEQRGRLIADRQIREVEARTEAELDRRRREAQEAREERDRALERLAERIDPNDPEYQAQLERDREEAIQRARDEEGLRAAQAQRELLLQTQQRQREIEEEAERRIREAQQQRRTAGEQELTEQLFETQRRRNEAEDRAEANRIRAEELERHNETLRQQRDSTRIAPLRDGSQFLTQEDRDDEIAERFSEQYRQIVLRQATAQQRQDPAFLERLEEFQDRVEEEYKYPTAQEGEVIPEEDRVFYINPFRPENEEFLRRQLAISRLGRGVEGRRMFEVGTRYGIESAGGVVGSDESRYTETASTYEYTEEQIQAELDRIRQEERDRLRQQIGRGQPAAEVDLRGFSSDEEEIDLGLGQASRSLTESQVERDLRQLQPQVDLSLEFDEEEIERAARGEPRRETPREQAQRQALERQSSQERVKRVLTEPEPEIDESLESLESEQDNWELVSSNFEAGNQTQFHLKGKPHKLNPQLSHFTFRDDEGWVGKGQTQGRFKGEDLVIVNVNPKDGNVKVRKKDAMREGVTQQRKDVEGNIQFRYLQNLIDQGEINLQEIDHNLQPIQQERGVVGRAAEAVGGAVMTAGGVMGNAALGAARGVGGAVYDRLPTAGQVGEAVGRGAVAVGSGLVGVGRGVYQAATSPVVGQQTGGTLGFDAEGRRIVGLGQVEDVED